jgi:hypothetical protein
MQAKVCRGVLVISLLLLSACATDPRTGSAKNTSINLEYGRVQQVEDVQLEANHGVGALVGGGLGLAVASRRSATTQVGATAAGALIGALVADARAGTAKRYTVDLVNGGNVAVVTEYHDISVNDCVAVEQGKHVNIRRVSAVMCTTHRSDAAFAEMNAGYMAKSKECLWAKEQLMQASTAEETDVAYKKMRAFCEA